jgi:hypothetical protein
VAAVAISIQLSAKNADEQRRSICRVGTAHHIFWLKRIDQPWQDWIMPVDDL